MPENARTEQDSFQRITASHRREYLGESSDDTHSDRRSYGDQRTFEEGRCHGQHGRLPDRRRYEDGGYPRRGYSNRGGGPPDDGRSLNDGGPPGNGRYLRYPGRWGPPGPPGPPGPVRPVIVQTPQVTLDTTALEIHLTLWDNPCYNWLEPKTKLINNYNNTYSKVNLICKCIQEHYNNLLHQPNSIILTTSLLAYWYMMVVIGKVSFHGWND